MWSPRLLWMPTKVTSGFRFAFFFLFFSFSFSMKFRFAPLKTSCATLWYSGLNTNALVVEKSWQTNKFVSNAWVWSWPGRAHRQGWGPSPLQTHRPSCSRSLWYIHQHLQHIPSRHSGEKPFMCEQCNYCATWLEVNWQVLGNDGLGFHFFNQNYFRQKYLDVCSLAVSLSIYIWVQVEKSVQLQ